MAVAANGDVLLGGGASAPPFAPIAQARGPSPAYVEERSPTGALEYSKELGGPADGAVDVIAVTDDGSAYVTGWTANPAFTTTTLVPSPSRPDIPGVPFLAKLSPAGDVLWASSLPATTEVTALGVDGQGNVYATAVAETADYPDAQPLYGTSACGDQHCMQSFLIKVDPSGTHLLLQILLGSIGSLHLAVDRAGNAYIDRNGEVRKIDPTGQELYRASPGGLSGDAIAVDGKGNAFVTGETQTLSPTRHAVQRRFGGGFSDAYAVELNSRGKVVYATYLGGHGKGRTGGVDQGFGIAVDGHDVVTVTGMTKSVNFPLRAPIQRHLTGGDCPDGDSEAPCYSPFVTQLDPRKGRLIFSTYLGVASYGAAVGVRGKDIYVLTDGGTVRIRP